MRIATSILSFLIPFVMTAQEAPMLDQVKELSQKRDKITLLMDELAKEGVVIRTGADADERPVFVGAQANFEHLFAKELKSGRLKSLSCVIHTPAPATPLCTDGAISEGLVDKAILNDSNRLLTVKERPELLRHLLDAQAKIYTVYPQGGRSVRTSEQLEIFDGLLQKYPNLSAVEMDLIDMPKPLVGATYFLEFAEGPKFIFSIMSCQANRPADEQWGIWYGPRGNKAVEERLNAIIPFLNRHAPSVIIE